MEDIWLYTSLTVVFLLFAFKVLLHRRRNHGNLPPSPPAFPVLGHLHLVKLPFHRALRTLSEKYGPIFSLRLGSRPVVVVSSPCAVEECFTKNDIVLANRPHFLSGKHLGYNHTTVDALPYGEDWRNLRRLCSIQILSSNRLNMFLGIRSDEVKLLLRRLSQDSRDKFAKVELKSLFSKLTFNTITRTIAGKRYHGEEVGMEEVKQFQEIIGEIFELGGTSNPMDYLPILEWVDYGGYKKKLMKLGRQTEAMLQCLIDERRNSKNRGLEDKSTTIDHLLSLQKSEPEYYTDEIIKGLILVLILGGSESTAVTIEWAMALLLNHPDALNKAREEIDIHVGQGRLMEESDLSKLGYLQNVISKTHRLYPAAPLLLPHMTSSHCQVGGFDIPKGTMLLINAWAIHRDPKAWDNPTSFKPERFNSEENNNYKLFPFGLGMRACPGSGLANKVMGLTLGLLIQCYEWKRVSKKEVDMAEGLGLTMPKAVPLEAMCKARDIIKMVV
ncbi:cytochrome P450 81Q32 [Vitis vinifera]|nr:cytochrome P450 81Q32 [Vitis vinifera]|eukprot:XP_002265855.1 PREDICTED: cytochrome P450 81E8 [Vitis vinifera]